MIIGIDVRPLLEDKYSGVANYLLNLLDALLDEDKNNKYKLFANSFKNRKNLSKYSKYSNVEIFYSSIPNKLLNFTFRYFKYPDLNIFMKGLDIFFMPNQNFYFCSKKAKKIITIHDFSYMFFPEMYSYKSRLWHYFIGLGRILDQADIIISVSENTKRDIQDLYKISAKKISVIPLAVGCETIDNKRILEIKKKYGIKKDYMLFLGNIEPRKNIELLIESMNLIDESLDLYVFGRGGSKLKILNSRIKYYDYLEEQDKPYLYFLAKIFAYPSIYEGFGLPPMEAMSYGTPVIAGNNSSLAEIFGTSAILVDPYNISEFVKEVNELIDNPERYAYYSNKGKLLASQYSWQYTAKKTLDILKRLS